MKLLFKIFLSLIVFGLLSCSEKKDSNTNPVEPTKLKSLQKVPGGENGVIINFNPPGGNLGNLTVGEYKVQQIVITNYGNISFSGYIHLNPPNSVWKLYDNRSSAESNASAYTQYNLDLNDFSQPDGYNKTFWIRFQPTTAGTQTNYLTVFDYGQVNVSSSPYSYNVTIPLPLAVTITGPEPRNIDSPSTYTAVVSGGKAPYIYTWYSMSESSSYQYVLMPGLTSSSITLSGGCVNDPGQPGAYVGIQCIVTDSNNPQQRASDTANASYQVCPRGGLE
jgi:hypothetical protein